MLTAFLITLGAVSYLNIGYWWGRLSWKVWQKGQRSFAGLLCFPGSYILNEIGDNSTSSLVGWCDKSEAYTKSLAFAWPIKMLINIVFLTFIGTVTLGSIVIIKPGSILVSLVCGQLLPKAIIARLTSLLPKRRHKELSPSPQPAQFSVDEYQHLLEQREKINTRLKELEAHPDKKILELPRRL